MSVTALPVTVEGLRSLLAVSRNSNEERTGRIGQEWEIREYAESHNIQIVDFVREFNIKRGTPLLLRPLLVDAVRRVQAGEAQGLLFRNQERIGEHAEELIDTLHHAGGVLVTTWDGVLHARAESEEEHVARLFEAARMADDRLRTQRRAAAGLRAKTFRGGYKGGNRLGAFRYGQELVQDFPTEGQTNYRPIPEQQLIIDRLIAADPNTGGIGWQAIADQLNQEGVPSPTGSQWRRQTTHKIAVREHQLRQRTKHGLIALQVPTATHTQETHASVHTANAQGTRNSGVADAG